jgi:hypothetical protein
MNAEVLRTLQTYPISEPQVVACHRPQRQRSRQTASSALAEVGVTAADSSANVSFGAPASNGGDCRPDRHSQPWRRNDNRHVQFYQCDGFD